MNKILSFFMMFNIFCQGTEHTNVYNWLYNGTIAALIGINYYLLHKNARLECDIKELKKDVKELKGNTIDVIIPHALHAAIGQNVGPDNAQFALLNSHIQNLFAQMRKTNEELQALKTLSNQASLILAGPAQQQPTARVDIKYLETNVKKTQDIMLDLCTHLTNLSDELSKQKICQQYHRNNFEATRNALANLMAIQQPLAINIQPAVAQNKKNSSIFNIFGSNKN